MMKQTVFAALVATAAVAGVAFAQQSAPSDAPAQAQPRSEGSDQSREDSGRRWRREFRRGEPDDGPERSDRRSDYREPPGGMMRGSGMTMDFCGPNAGRFAAAMLERIERTRPTEQQKPDFDKLKEAASRAAETAKAGCPSEASLTPPGQLADDEKRLRAMLEAIRTLRPTMDAYYNLLSDEQKARLLVSRDATNMSPTDDRRGGWRGPERGEPRNNYRNLEREGYGDRRSDRD